MQVECLIHMFNFLRNFHSVFQNDCIILHSRGSLSSACSTSLLTLDVISFNLDLIHLELMFLCSPKYE